MRVMREITMKIDIKDDLKNNRVIISVSIKRRRFSSQKRRTFQWKDITLLVEKYNPPKGYILGNCERECQIVDNSRDDRLKREWIFNLVKEGGSERPSPLSTTKSVTPSAKTDPRTNGKTASEDVLPPATTSSPRKRKKSTRPRARTQKSEE